MALISVEALATPGRLGGGRSWREMERTFDFNDPPDAAFRPPLRQHVFDDYHEGLLFTGSETGPGQRPLPRVWSWQELYNMSPHGAMDGDFFYHEEDFYDYDDFEFW